MRVAVGALLFEGNSFSLSRAGIEAFENNYLERGQDVLSKLRGGGVEVSGALSVFDKAGSEIVPLIASHGGCGGAVRRRVFEQLRDELVAPLAHGPIDGIYLALHGAMACEETDHPEVELLRMVRAAVGDIPIVVSLDLHANVTPDLVALCTAIVCYQQYPHDDAFETGIRGARLLLHALAGRPLRMAYRKLAMLISPTTGGTRLSPAMRAIYRECRALEGVPGVLAASYFMLTPWLERRDGGSGFVLVVDDPAIDAGALADALIAKLWAARHAFVPKLTTVEAAVAETIGAEAKPIILSEMSDAVGAGAGGDSVYAVRQFLALDTGATLLAQVVDPEVVAQTAQSPLGAELTVAVGNKIENRYGPPIVLKARVMRFFNGAFTYSGGLMSGVRASIGNSVVLQADKLMLLVSTYPSYEYADEQYQAAGLDPRQFKFVLVKNPMNFQQTYAWAPKLFALDTPGAAAADLARLDWTLCERPFFPLDDGPQPCMRP